MSTGERLVAAAAALLDSGGEGAVTLRAVGQAVGVSHNAPYKHFKDRSALLAAVAVRDFGTLTDSFSEIRRSPSTPMSKLKRALGTLIDYAHEYPSRYRLLFSDPDVAARGGDLQEAAVRTFAGLAAIVGECQASGDLPEASNVALTGLLCASAHGLIDIEAGGRMRQEKGLTGVAEGMDLLIGLISHGGARPGSERGSPGTRGPA